SRRRHTRSYGDWSSDVCSSDLMKPAAVGAFHSNRSGLHGLGVLYPAVAWRRTELFVFWSAADGAFCGRRAYSWLCRVANGQMKRSEERRVGKEGRCGGERGGWR